MTATALTRLYDATWGRGFSALYDRGLKATEEAGLRRMRQELLAAASGTVIELGAGTGANLTLYPEAIDDLVMVEAGAEHLPFEDSSFDTAVATIAASSLALDQVEHDRLPKALPLVRPMVHGSATLP